MIMIISAIKSIFFTLYKTFILSIFNLRHNTKIKSKYASTKAKYGIGVLIDQNTHILDNVIIGNYSYVNFESWLENCTLGNYCSISDHVMICPSEHRINKILSHPIFGEKKTERVIIGNDVLISHNATILEGVHIGDGAVIGAGAVVTRDVRPYTIVGGVPARYIKNRFYDDKKINLIKKYDIYHLDKKAIINLESEGKI